MRCDACRGSAAQAEHALFYIASRYGQDRAAP